MNSAWSKVSDGMRFRAVWAHPKPKTFWTNPKHEFLNFKSIYVQEENHIISEEKCQATKETFL